ncbi:tRNA pseudouridine(55) synthase TruB [bacterium]|nr:tRNA pseudouridine(55) synthase TruB [bacterium]
MPTYSRPNRVARALQRSCSQSSGTLRAMNGLLLIDKPKGWTSFDVVAKVRGVIAAYTRANQLPRLKVGHTGTLDPMATGLLVLAIGNYTKKIATLTKHDKTYIAKITLGKTSNTDDVEGELIDVSGIEPSNDAVFEALQSFVGDSMQVPPQFSAIKIGGVRSYKAARAGEQVALQPRPVKIYAITDVVYKYPTVSCMVSVGSGTYIRSIARDLGQKLGTGAYLSDLRRTTVGGFSVNAASAKNC